MQDSQATAAPLSRPARGGPDGTPPPPPPEDPSRSGTRVHRLRLALILAGLGLIAGLSLVFGMMMALASDLDDLEGTSQFRAAKNSVLLDSRGGVLAQLTGNQNRILLGETEMSPLLTNAVTAVEDRRYYEHEGVDYRGIARALVQDLREQRAAQGGSTITQQFVKNALVAQGNRTVFQKLREAALAYHLERQWSKQKILTQYLNSVYFGNGAYGVESAMRTYFGKPGGSYGPREREASPTSVEPHEAALLAGIIASPSGYDPVQNPKDAKARRDLVLRRMLEQGMISRAEFDDALLRVVPSEEDINPPTPDSKQPYFSTWVTQQLVDRYKAGNVFGGGLEITTTLDAELQARAQKAIENRLGLPGGPTASLVAIENRTGKVRALVGGSNFRERPFNLATNGHRQPGSAFKPFILVEALRQGVTPGQTFESRKKVFGASDDKFVVNNYEDRYAGISTLANATAQSDNSVFAELGLDLGTRKVARLAKRMGVRTKISTNRAMTLGGLEEGLTPLEMAFAYSTLANRGMRASGTLAASERGPVAVETVRDPRRDEVIHNRRRANRVFPEAVGQTAQGVLAGVMTGGTGTRARLEEFAAGKTGTTENYGDAWFVGFDSKITVAVWVGYPDELRSMETEYKGEPVSGGTFPAEIWRDFMMSAIALREERDPKEPDEPDAETPPLDATPTTPQAGADPAPVPAPTTTPEAGGTGAPAGPAPTPEPDPQAPDATEEPATPAPEPSPEPAPAPTPAAPAPTPAPVEPSGGDPATPAAPG